MAAASVTCWQREGCRVSNQPFGSQSNYAEIIPRKLRSLKGKSCHQGWREKPQAATLALNSSLGFGGWQLPLRDSENSLSLKIKRGREPERCCSSDRSLLLLCQFRHPFRILGSLANIVHRFSRLFPLVMHSTLRLWWKLSQHLLSRFPISSASHPSPSWHRPKVSYTQGLFPQSSKCNLFLKLSPVWGAQGMALFRLWKKEYVCKGSKNGWHHGVWLHWITQEVIATFMTKQIWVAIVEGFVYLFWGFVVTWFSFLVGSYTPSPDFVLLAHRMGIRNPHKYIFF